MNVVRRLLIVAFVGFGLAWGDRASAHALGVEVKRHGETIQVDAYYDDGTPARSATVTIESDVSPSLLEGRTDADGRWVGPTPPPGKYRVNVNALDGHVARTTITILESATTVAPPKAQTAQRVSNSPSREEFTTFPWWKLAIGLGLCTIFSGLAWLRTRRKKSRTTRYS